MATRDNVTNFGLRSAATPSSTNSRSCVTVLGFFSAASKVPWGGSEGSRKLEDWLPRIDEKPIDPRTGLFTRRWYNYFRMIGERLGGVQGASIPQIVESVTQTQTQAASTTAYAAQVGTYAQGIAATVTAVTEVAQTNELSGSTSIPDVPDPPDRYSYKFDETLL